MARCAIQERGRVLMMMPHPERIFRFAQWSYVPEGAEGEFSPWMQMFVNARNWVG